LFTMAKDKAAPSSICISPDGERFVVSAIDMRYRIFRFDTGKLTRKYDEALPVFEALDRSGVLGLDTLDFGKRCAVERELLSTPSAPPSNAVFDETGHFIIYATLLGVKIVNIETNKLVSTLGRVENTERFLSVALFQGITKVNSQRALDIKSKQTGDDLNKKAEPDPLIVCTAFKKQRFYYFSKHEPSADDNDGVGRDVFNEKPTVEDMEMVTVTETALGREAIIRTSMGDIYIRLFYEQCPKAVENFTTHSRNGYYDGVIFHRVIKQFMIQTGDPLGDGTGGESIWGTDFEDEFHRDLRHDRPFTVSMANSGPKTNGSQFFITTVPCEWLDNKHTVFGRVTKGMDVVSAIEKARVGNLDKPFEDIRIMNVDIRVM